MTDISLIQADARKLPIADGVVQCVVTSPPYWGLRKYAGDQGEAPYGLEPTIEAYLATTIEVLRELRRVLRPDGVVFWNIGDSYCSGAYSPRTRENRETLESRALRTDGRLDHTPHNWTIDANKIPRNGIPDGLKPKDLCLIPERVAIAAQADGWWVRSIIIWAKPNPMPESCTDRPTDAYEHIIMLTKSERYFWDADAVREPAVHAGETRITSAKGMSNGQAMGIGVNPSGNGKPGSVITIAAGRNMRNVWTFPTQPYKGAHFATFPEEIPRRCILAATSERGACVSCGAPWQRVTSTKYHNDTTTDGRPAEGNNIKGGREDGARTFASGVRTRRIDTTLGWKPTCKCFPGLETSPCLVLDPFGGSGTTARVAVELNRRAVSLDLAYHDHAEKRTRNVQRNLIGV